jgi:F-type H+-transporting ATPase subunit c
MRGKMVSMVILAVMFLGFASTALASDDAQASSAGGSFLSDKGAGKFGGPIGAGLVLIGGAAGIGRLASVACESIARQPEAGGRIFTSMIITAGMIEGATFFGVIVCLLAAIL